MYLGITTPKVFIESTAKYNWQTQRRKGFLCVCFVHYWLYSQCGMLKKLLSLNCKKKAMHLLILSNGHEAIKKSRLSCLRVIEIKTFQIF